MIGKIKQIKRGHQSIWQFSGQVYYFAEAKNSFIAHFFSGHKDWMLMLHIFFCPKQAKRDKAKTIYPSWADYQAFQG